MSRIGNLTLVDPYSYYMCDHTYKHAFSVVYYIYSNTTTVVAIYHYSVHVLAISVACGLLSRETKSPKTTAVHPSATLLRLFAVTSNQVGTSVAEQEEPMSDHIKKRNNVVPGRY